jgi:ABC-type antimicrobial peptide transport system permease subunit
VRKMKVGELFSLAMASIKWRKGRSLIATCGIAIAVAATIAIPGIMDTGMNDWQRIISYYFPNRNMFFVTLGMRVGSGMGGGWNTYALPVFTKEDVNATKELEGVNAVYPVLSGQGGSFKINGSYVFTPVSLEILPNEAIDILVTSDRLLNGAIEENATIFEYDAAMSIFNSTDVVGKNFTFVTQQNETMTLQVGGVLKRVKPPSIGGMGGLNLNVYIPMGLIPDYEHIDRYDSILVIASGKTSEVRDNVVALLKTRLNERNTNLSGLEIWAMTETDEVEMIRESIGSFESIAYVIAGFSLLVGMVVIGVVALSVAYEELQGITVMRVMGASRNETFLYILFIAVGIGLIGLVIGIAFSLAAGFGLVTAFNLGTYVLPPVSRILTAIILSLAISTVAGIYPAYRISRLDPAIVLSRAE